MKTEKTILKIEEQAAFALRALYAGYGYLPYKMSRFEEYDLYVRNKDFLASQQIITFADRSGKLLALKPDVTLSIIKNAPVEKGSVQKLYYNESVFRADPASHTLKEILQAGLECVGDLTSYEIGEVLLLAAKSLALLSGEFLLDISHMGLINGVLDSCGLSGDTRTEALQCISRKNTHELMALCGSLSQDRQQKLRALADLSGTPDRVLPQMEALLTEPEEREALRELKQLCGLLTAYAENIRIDFSVGNSMKYYNGVVFKGYLAGLPSSILSGGQYDKLLRKLGKGGRAIGFALYLSMLERQNENAGLFDVDTLILQDGSLEPDALLALVENARRSGTVLVASAVPAGRSFRRQITVKNGEVLNLGNG